MIVVLVVASGATWEPRALGVLAGHPGIVVLKRCVDVDDLLAAATAGQAEAAVLDLEAPGLDAAAVEHLRRHGVRPVAVVADDGLDAGRVRAGRIGIGSLLPVSELDGLPLAITTGDVAVPEASDDEPELPTPAGGGRVVVVWGPAGAPGRSTVASAVAADLARRGRRSILVDADPYGGSVAQQLGIMDEVSGLLAASRLVTSGQLEEHFSTVQRGIDAHLSVVTGLPRPDRWVEVRAGTVEQILDVGRNHGDVVVDTGFCLEDDPGHDFGTRPGRNELTLGALGSADEILVVGSADPVGLSRLARALVELRELTSGRAVRVVVNRMRSSLGWSEKDIAGMVAGFTRLGGLHFLPDDPTTVDRALVAGRTLTEVGDSALGRAVASLVDTMGGPSAPVRPRRAGTARPR